LPCCSAFSTQENGDGWFSATNKQNKKDDKWFPLTKEKRWWVVLRDEKMQIMAGN
jgi:hypothetical protein